MTAAESLANILAEYTVENGVIRNPGKFECEPVWVPYFWDLALSGEGDDVYTSTEADAEESELVCTTFKVDAEEAEVFGLECGATVELREDSQGFVIGEVL